MSSINQVTHEIHRASSWAKLLEMRSAAVRALEGYARPDRAGL